MTNLEYLQKCREIAYHNLYCYSRNLSMTMPKAGYEAEWNQSLEECRIVEELIAEEKSQQATLSGPIVLVIDQHVLGLWDKVRDALDVLAQAKPKGGMHRAAGK